MTTGKFQQSGARIRSVNASDLLTCLSVTTLEVCESSISTLEVHWRVGVLEVCGRFVGALKVC